jgi:hypothetical protein
MNLYPDDERCTMLNIYTQIYILRKCMHCVHIDTSENAVPTSKYVDTPASVLRGHLLHIHVNTV